MNNEVDQLSGGVRYYGVKINGHLYPGHYSTEGEANAHGTQSCNEGDSMVIVPVTSADKEILLG